MTFFDAGARFYNGKRATAQEVPFDALQAYVEAVDYDSLVAAMQGTGFVAGLKVTAQGGRVIAWEAGVVEVDSVPINVAAGSATCAANATVLTRMDSLRVSSDGTVYIAQGTPGGTPVCAPLHRTNSVIDEVFFAKVEVPGGAADIPDAYITPRGFPVVTAGGGGVSSGPMYVNVAAYGAKNDFNDDYSWNDTTIRVSPFNAFASQTVSNRENLRLNDIALADATTAARALNANVFMPNGQYAFSPGILYTNTNDIGFKGEDIGSVKLFMVDMGQTRGNGGVVPRGTGVGVHAQLTSPGYWGKNAGPDSDALLGLRAAPALDGFTIDMRWASGMEWPITASGPNAGRVEYFDGNEVNQGVKIFNCGSVGLCVGSAVSAYYEVQVHNALGTGGVAVVARSGGLGNRQVTPAGTTDSIGILWQNTAYDDTYNGSPSPFKVAGNGDPVRATWSEEVTWGPRTGVRKCKRGFVVDKDWDHRYAQHSAMQSFGYNSIEHLFIQNGGTGFEILNGAWLYNTDMVIKGNNGNGHTVFYLDEHDSRFTGGVTIGMETNGKAYVSGSSGPHAPEVRFFHIKNGANWASHGLIDLLRFGPFVNSVIPNAGCFSHTGEGHFGDVPSVGGWENALTFGGGTYNHSTKVLDFGGQVGDLSKLFRIGTKVRWNRGGQKYFGLVTKDATYDGNSTRVPVGNNNEIGTGNVDMGSVRYSYQNPPDFPDNADDLAGGQTFGPGMNVLPKTPWNFGLKAIGSFPRLRLAAMDGTEGNPNALEQGNVLGLIAFMGSDSGSSTPVTGSYIQATTVEAWTVTRHGSHLEFFTTAPGAVKPPDDPQMILGATGNLVVQGVITANGQVLGSGDFSGDHALTGIPAFMGVTAPSSAARLRMSKAQPVTADDVYAQVEGFGKDGAGSIVQGAFMRFEGAEVWTAARHGSRIRWYSTKTGEDGPTLGMTLGSTHNLTVAGNVIANGVTLTGAAAEQGFQGNHEITSFFGVKTVGVTSRIRATRIQAGAGVPANGEIGRFEVFADDGSHDEGNVGPYMRMVAVQQWSDGAHGAKIEVYTTAPGQVTPALAFTVGSGGDLLVEGNFGFNGKGAVTTPTWGAPIASGSGSPFLRSAFTVSTASDGVARRLAALITDLRAKGVIP